MRIAALLVFVTACTTSRELQKPLNASDLRALNESVRDRDVDLSFAAESSWLHVEATQVHLAPTQTRFVVEGNEREVPTMALHQLTYLSPGSPHAEGALQGLLFGLPVTVAGLAVGASVAATCAPHTSCTGETVAPIAVGAALGLVLAPAVGALIGHHDEVTFTSPR